MNAMNTDNGGLMRGFLITSCLVAIIFTSIFATFMLSNDRKYLHILMIRLGYKIDQKEVRVTTPVAITSPEKDSVFPVPTRLFESHDYGPLGSFSREHTFVSTNFCDIANGVIGQPVLIWKKSELWNGEADCSGELSASHDANGDARSSLFIQARGLENGRVATFRMKLVLNPANSDQIYLQTFVAISSEIIKRNNWRDFDDILVKIKSLQDFNEIHFGVSISLKKEFTVENAYDLIMVPVFTKNIWAIKDGFENKMSFPIPAGQAQ